MSNQIAPHEQKPKFISMIATSGYQKVIARTLPDPERARRFTTSITSAVIANPDLQKCDPDTILTCALQGESFNFHPSPQAGHFYLVPFFNKNKQCHDAQFIIGYKGFIQLALRSREYKKLNVTAIKEGEFRHWDPLNEELETISIQDVDEREKAKTVGYYAMFETVYGFKKAMFWTSNQMESHALKFSKGYQAKKGYTFWEKDFDVMATKTMLRQLLSKWGPSSIEMQEAINVDTTHEQNANIIIGEIEDIPSAPAQDSTPIAEGESEVTLSEL